VSKVIAGLLVLAVALAALALVDWRAVGAPAVAASSMPTAPTPTPSPAEYGRSLFLTKGCTTCHRHEGLNVARVDAANDGRALFEGMGAPDLTHYQPDPAFVRVWLKDPQAVRPNTAMPNLGLKEVEIEALLAFLQTNSAAE
jgi:cytochrome c2